MTLKKATDITMDYKFRMSQDDLRYLYETAQSRMLAHTAFAEDQKKIIHDFAFFKTEREALEAALTEMRNGQSDYQIWARIEKKDDIFRIVDWWIVTDDWKIKQAADYIGMALMYDTPRLSRLIYDNASIDDVLAYQ